MNLVCILLSSEDEQPILIGIKARNYLKSRLMHWINKRINWKLAWWHVGQYDVFFAAIKKKSPWIKGEKNNNLHAWNISSCHQNFCLVYIKREREREEDPFIHGKIKGKEEPKQTTILNEMYECVCVWRHNNRKKKWNTRPRETQRNENK